MWYSRGWLRRIAGILAVILTASLSLLFIKVQLATTPFYEHAVSIAAFADFKPQVNISVPEKEIERVKETTESAPQATAESSPVKSETVKSETIDSEIEYVRVDPDTGIPAFLTGSITPPSTGSPLVEAVSFFDANKDLYQMTDPGADLVEKRQVVDEIGMVHLHMNQVYNGIPVFGSEMSVHINSGNKIYAVNGRYVPDIELSVDPKITLDMAVATALEDLGTPAAPSTFEPPQLVVYAPDATEAVLAWQITLANDDPPTRMVYFINAQVGSVAYRYDVLENVKNRQTYTAGNGTTTPGTLIISEGGSSGDSVAQAAHNNIGATYDYYFNTFGRDSFNNAGPTLKSTVHYGSSYNNAYWNGQQMVYGDGDGNVFSPLGNSLDVVAHELTHAVTQYTANLVYSNQSGALNESYSDVFGVMVDRDDWLLGDDVYTPHTAGDALRSVSNPSVYGQPEHMNNYVNTSSDNGGVHTNSGIPNKAAYNIATTIGKDKMERIWYRTLTVYLNSGSQFSDARDASVQAATDLYGSGSPEVIAVQNGFAAVGIGAGQTSNQTARIEIDHTYRGDLVVTLGVGNPDSPSWSTVVSNRSGGSADNIYSTVDISGSSAYLPPSWQNQWFLKVYDAAGQDTGSIRTFSITNNGETYTATDTPVSINDFVTVYSYVTPPSVPVDPAFVDKWNALSGAPGNGIDVAHTISGGKYQDFSNGRLYYNQAQDAVYWINGAILIKYDQMSRETGGLGLPLTDEFDVSGVTGARMNEFTGGNIYWGPGVGTYSVKAGVFMERYLAPGGGPAVFGLPTSDEYTAWLGKAQNMQRATLTWDGNAGTPAYAAYGGVMVKYNYLGGPRGALHLITAEEADVPGTVPGVPDARYAIFQNGNVFWSSVTGSHTVNGGVYARYNGQYKYCDPGTNNCGPSSRLGMPITDEYAIALPGGAARSAFQHGFVTWWAPYGTWIDVL